MLYSVPTPLLVVLEVEGQLGPTVGTLDTGATVKESHVQRAPPSQYTEGVGGQVGFGVGGVAWVLGDGWQGPQPLEDELKDGQGIISAIADKILTAAGQLRMFVAASCGCSLQACSNSGLVRGLSWALPAPKTTAMGNSVLKSTTQIKQ